MKKVLTYTILLLLSSRLHAQSDTLTNLAEDPTRNRLFLMSTGDIQPMGFVGIQVHEFVACEIIYSPTNYFQINAGYGVPKQFVLGGKLQIVRNFGIMKSLAVNFDALLFMHNHKKDVYYFIPNINVSFGSENTQLSLSLTPLEMEKYRYDPTLYANDWWYEGDRFVKEKMIYVVPAIAQIGLMSHSPALRLKFIFEIHFVYDGKKDNMLVKAASVGVRKYWSDLYLDFALFHLPNYEKYPSPATIYYLPFLSIGFFI